MEDFKGGPDQMFLLTVRRRMLLQRIEPLFLMDTMQSSKTKHGYVLIMDAQLFDSLVKNIAVLDEIARNVAVCYTGNIYERNLFDLTIIPSSVLEDGQAYCIGKAFSYELHVYDTRYTMEYIPNGSLPDAVRKELKGILPETVEEQGGIDHGEVQG